jgi:protein TonB
MKFNIPIILLLLVNFVVKAQNKRAVPLKDDKIYQTVEIMPEYPGGFQNFYIYLLKNIRYAKPDHNQNKSYILVKFIVEKDGSLSAITVEKSPSDVLTEEVLRAANHSPKWRPGMRNGRPVRVRYSLPLTICLTDDI